MKQRARNRRIRWIVTFLQCSFLLSVLSTFCFVSYFGYRFVVQISRACNRQMNKTHFTVLGVFMRNLSSIVHIQSMLKPQAISSNNIGNSLLLLIGFVHRTRRRRSREHGLNAGEESLSKLERVNLEQLG